MPKKSSPQNEVLGEVTGADFEPLEESVVQGPDKELIEDLKDRTPPKTYDVDWENYVMSFFEPHELDQGLPKVRGLRRVTRLLYGPIISGVAKITQSPNLDNGERAAVEYTLKIRKIRHLDPGEIDGQIIEFTDGADAWWKNISGVEYGKFPTANAITRAEGRALRKALNLDIVAAEEISDNMAIVEPVSDGRINESQINKLDTKCMQLNINVMSFIGLGKYTNVEEIPHHKVVKMFGLLSNYQRGEDDDGKPLEIPDKIRGYTPNWRQS